MSALRRDHQRQGPRMLEVRGDIKEMTDAEYQQLTRRLSAYGLSLCERIDVIHSAAMMMVSLGMQNPAARVAANRTLAYLEREAERVKNGGNDGTQG